MSTVQYSGFIDGGQWVRGAVGRRNARRHLDSNFDKLQGYNSDYNKIIYRLTDFDLVSGKIRQFLS